MKKKNSIEENYLSTNLSYMDALFQDYLDNDIDDNYRDEKTTHESLKNKQKEEMENLIKSIFVDPNDDSIEIDPLIQIKAENGFAPVFSLNNISTIIGKPKSKKTIFLSLLISEIISKNINTGTFKVGDHKKNRILIFDTEQSKSFAKLTYSRIEQITKLDSMANVQVLSLRETPQWERIDYIEKIINHYDDILLVIIDGIRDLISDINNLHASSVLLNKLLKWSTVGNLHIMNVIHQNKIDPNARGHLGTELVNKSESVILVENSSENRSIIKPISTRAKSFKPFAIAINDNGTPFIDENWKSEKPKLVKAALEPSSINLLEHQKIISEVFTNGEIKGYKKLTIAIKDSWIKNGYNLGNAKVVSFIRFYLNTNLIKKIDQSRPSKYISG
ncbi:hypothetical protein PQG46_06475 [Aquirufa nivalisilvae]